MTNKFCHTYQILSIKQTTPCHSTETITGWMEYYTKNTHLFYIVFQGLKVLTCHKNLQDTPTRSFISCFILAFTSADIIFVKFLELNSTLSEKEILVTNFPFFNRFTHIYLNIIYLKKLLAKSFPFLTDIYS